MRPGRTGGGAVWAAVILVLGVTGCGGQAGPGPLSTVPVPSPVGSRVALPVASAPPVVSPSDDASPPPTPGASPSVSVAQPPGAGVTLDGTLLGVLPADIDGIPVQPEPAAFADAASDPAFVANVEAAAFATVVDAATDDLASGVVARLRPGIFSDGFFRDWRDTYNRGACAQSGGVVRNAEAPLGGRTTYITTCAGGLRVYHAYLEPQDVVVSLISVGDGRFGERLMDGLRP